VPITYTLLSGIACLLLFVKYAYTCEQRSDFIQQTLQHNNLQLLSILMVCGF